MPSLHGFPLPCSRIVILYLYSTFPRMSTFPDPYHENQVPFSPGGIRQDSFVGFLPVQARHLAHCTQESKKAIYDHPIFRGYGYMPVHREPSSAQSVTVTPSLGKRCPVYPRAEPHPGQRGSLGAKLGRRIIRMPLKSPGEYGSA